MSDPQDLLYTNQFITPTVLSNQDLLKNTRYYNRFQEYIDKETPNEIQTYLNDNQFEDSPINLNKNLYQKWPTNNIKNQYPLFDTYIKDISVNKYQKEIITKKIFLINTWWETI